MPRNNPCGCGSGKKFKKCCLDFFRSAEQDMKRGAQYIKGPDWPFIIKIREAPTLENIVNRPLSRNTRRVHSL